ncbi:MAG: hypothetical protein HY051_03850 [Candidatus Aenigmarchaeota archaeon]|nr:hypothetical protein [Candidatus Aenigmarchaeota archaeon]
MTSGKERANWPDKTDTFKVVQLYVDDEPYLRFGSADSIHGHILADCLDKLKVPYHTMPNQDGDEIPIAEGERYRASGMGYGIVLPELTEVSFLGNSADYQIGIDADHLQKIREISPDWVLEMK